MDYFATNIAFAALALQMGARVDELDALWASMFTAPLPTSPRDAARQMETAIATLRAQGGAQ